MIPMLLWAVLLAMGAVLAWRALSVGGLLWFTVGAIALVTFGGEIWKAAPELFHAIAAEKLMDPQPVLTTWTGIVSFLLLVSPARPKLKINP